MNGRTPYNGPVVPAPAGTPWTGGTSATSLPAWYQQEVAASQPGAPAVAPTAGPGGAPAGEKLNSATGQYVASNYVQPPIVISGQGGNPSYTTFAGQQGTPGYYTDPATGKTMYGMIPAGATQLTGNQNQPQGATVNSTPQYNSISQYLSQSGQGGNSPAMGAQQLMQYLGQMMPQTTTPMPTPA